MRQNCEVENCDVKVAIRLFGHDYCWKHYSDWIMSFRASDSLRESERHPQQDLPFGDMPDYSSEDRGDF